MASLPLKALNNSRTTPREAEGFSQPLSTHGFAAPSNTPKLPSDCSCAASVTRHDTTRR
jgi:hypothetical protein